MKQLTFVFPKLKADEFAQFSFTHDVRVILSWLEGSDFFFSNDQVTAICAVSDERLEDVKKSDFFKFVKK